MAVFYTLYQNNREGFATKGKWYARVRVNKVKTMKDIAREIQDIASVRKSDVMAVLTELPDVMNKMLQEGHRVKLDGFGSFKVGIKTKPSDTVKDFSVTKNIKSSHIIFQPDRLYEANGKKGTRFLASTLEFSEWGRGSGDEGSNP
ncbi:HU family DNA-binding protein [Prevotella sp. Rep29]|uniref:HU family DNA-binding protein n=1 Tax=Prevotella sp. Rep29 TaxID=2691580 RepID=UPI001C6DE39B|nr:HU family DNA-binding protein [Prevotella sp. Rep29]QYR10912.1 DNA-binding protein [Prevotella sp. Rep29]